MSPWYETGMGNSCAWPWLSHPRNLPCGAGSCQSCCHAPAWGRRACCLRCPSTGISSCLSPGRCWSWCGVSPEPWQSPLDADTAPAPAKAELSLRRLLALAASMALQVVAGTRFTATPFQSIPLSAQGSPGGCGAPALQAEPVPVDSTGAPRGNEMPGPLHISKNNPKDSLGVSLPRSRPQKFISLSCLGQLALLSHR